MATSFVVIATDLRRATVKGPAGGYMIDVLEEACAKLKLEAETYQLKYKNKIINLTDPIRAAGLIQGAKLELVVKSKSASVVTVALRLPPSEARLGIPHNRLTAKVRSDTPLWRLLRHLEESDEARSKGLNITARGVPRADSGGSGSGQLYWEAPVLKLAGRELSSLADLGKTLSQVGIDAGSQLIVLEFRLSEQPLQEAMEAVHAELEKTDAEAAADRAAAAETAPAPAPDAAPPQGSADRPAEVVPQPGPGEAAPEAMDLEARVPAEAQPQDPLRPVQVWAPPRAGASMPAAAALRWAKDAESSLAPSIAQMKAHQKHLEEAGRNRRLKSDDELAAEAAERQARAAAVDKVDVRIRFPDGYTVMWSFPNGATGATLHEAVRNVLRPAVLAASPFRLVPPMSRDAVQDQSGPKHDLVRGYGMRGGVVLNFLRDASQPPPPAGQVYVKPEVAALARDYVIPQAALGGTGEDDDDDDDDKGKTVAAVGASRAGGSDGKGDPMKKMSKFLRLSKK